MKKQDILENQVNFAYLALGSNLGDKKNNLNKSIDLIQKEGIFIKKRSKFYSTKSWPNENFPNFINSIILIETKLNITELFLKDLANSLLWVARLFTALAKSLKFLFIFFWFDYFIFVIFFYQMLRKFKLNIN